ncbi:MAG: ATP-dependent RecD-like DNA helicase [Firmicutes bacterium]|nr:ATP-dependent RecD-like DNA helicase [Bacillota bacterium]
MNKQEERTGTIVEIIFRNEENGYTVAVMETDTEYFTVVGNLPRCLKGARFRLTGSFREHPSYGEQFVFREFEEILPEEKSAIFDFLSSGAIKGVGPVTAAALVAAFGDETLNVIETEPGRLTEVKGVGEKTAATIAASFAEHRQFAKIALAFQEYGLTTAQALRLYRAYGADAVALIEEDPYRLIDEVPGFGFRKADQIAEQMGISRESPRRIVSGVKYTLYYYVSEGSTYVPRQELLERTSELLDLSAELIDDELINMAFRAEIKIDSLEGQETVYLYPYYATEQYLVADLARLAGAVLPPLDLKVENAIRQTEAETGIRLSEKQKEAVTRALENGISVITGGPGTGKTTIINALIRVLEYAGLKTALAAPTGRAAKRITETSGRYASTIHRLLEYAYAEDEDELRFGKTSDSPLEYDVVIVDEASMIDLMLMRGLTDAIRTGTRLLLIGDSDQLPSVGAGNVLRDLIESDFVFTIRLTEIFRQAEESMIVVNAHRINHGEFPFLNEKDKDFFFMERRSEEEIRDLMKELVTTRLSAYYADLDPQKDIQILTPVRKGLLGTGTMNELLQAALNPPAPGKEEKKAGGRIFREGDKVMQIKNNYQLAWKKRSDLSEGQGVYNGDVGWIQTIDPESQLVTVVFDEDKFVSYDFSQLEELELAYAITVHKSQGSEFPVVVMPVSWFTPMLASRNLLYTAVTRGKRLVVLCGSKRRLEAMIDNNRTRLRYSGLAARLKRLLGTEA